MKRFLTVGGTLALLGVLCMGQAALAASSAMLSFVPKVGETYRYSMTMAMDMEMQMPNLPGQDKETVPATQQTTSTSEFIFRQEVTGLDEKGNFILKITYESMNMKMKMGDTEIPMPPQPGIEGQTFDAVMDPEGKIISMDMGSLGLDSKMTVKQLYAYSGLTVPNEKVKVGSKWLESQVVEVPFGFGKALNESIAVENTLAGFEKLDGVKTAKIDQTFMIKQGMDKTNEPGFLDGKMEEDLAKPGDTASSEDREEMKRVMGGMDISTMGTGTGTMYWDYKRNLPIAQNSALVMDMTMKMPNPAAHAGENSVADEPADKAASEEKPAAKAPAQPETIEMTMKMKIRMNMTLLPEAAPAVKKVASQEKLEQK